MTPDELREECEAQYCPSWLGASVRDLIWEKAWEQGHANGASEVKFWYDDLMDIPRAMMSPTT